MVHPLGLAAKGSAWYLVADTDAGLRTFRVDRVSSVEATGQPAVRPAGFDLTEAWRLIIDEVEQRRTPVRAHARVRPDIVALCRAAFGSRMQIGPPGPDGWVAVELRGHSTRSLAGELAGFGAWLEVDDPSEVRDDVAGIGQELVAVYGPAPAVPSTG